MKTTIDKAELKKQIIYNVKTLYRKTIDEATPQQVFQAVSYALKDDIIDQCIFDIHQEMVSFCSLFFLCAFMLNNIFVYLHR